MTYIGLDGKAVAGRDHFATATTSYDPRGNIIERRFLDAGGKPVHSRAGCGGWHSVYDERQHEISRTYVDTAGTPMNLPEEGYATLKWAFDDRGRVSEETYLDKDGAPRLQKYASERLVHDARGNLVEEAFFGADGRPSVNSWNARAEYSRDRFGIGRAHV